MRKEQRTTNYIKRVTFKRFLVGLLSLALIVTLAPAVPGIGLEVSAADVLSGDTVKPVVVLSGKGILGGDTYSQTTISNEKSYTMDELKALADEDENSSTHNQYLYSAYNTSNNASIYLGEGIRLDTLLGKSGVTSDQFDENIISLIAPDNYAVKFDPSKNTVGEASGASKSQSLGVTRYYYPNIKASGEGNSDDAAEVPTILAWAVGGSKGSTDIPDTVNGLGGKLQSMTGQIALNDYNNPLFNSDVIKVIVGDPVTESKITIDGRQLTRSEILMMDRADRSYTYTTSGGEATDYVRGVPLSVLLSAYNENDTVNFTTADNYPAGGISMTVAECINSNYILAYEKGQDEDSLKGIYDTAKGNSSIYGFYALYGDNSKPSKLINSISITPASGTDFTTSPYKHINNGGITNQEGPYEIDAITGATLTIEGPGVTSSVPLPIRELENQNAGAFRGVYTDNRDGEDWTLQYEGIRLSHIVNHMTSGDNGIHLTDKAHKVLLKNRVRQTIAEFTLDQIQDAETAGKPIIIAYGTGTEDGNTVAPFVFDGAAGLKDSLDNDDGPIKLVYDKSVFGTDPNPDYTEFGNVAYLYIAEDTSPGYKHNTEPYNTPEQTQYVLTITGDKIGREVNYTVDQLEGMVEYGPDGRPDSEGLGYRDEYSLANSSYWYVNEYEGIQLWKLLLKSGLASENATNEHKGTLVSFSATDNYKDFDKFTIEQIANPNLFGYYEKNPADLNDGNNTGDDSVDLRRTGFPVLVAYGVNSYPYVIKNTAAGYMSGLANDGGPLRIISGKINYSHANGSKQAKLLDKVIVGNDYYYSTHKYNPNFSGAYQEIADTSSIHVKVVSGSTPEAAVLKEKSYKVGEIEELIYGNKLTTAQLKEAKVKGFYEVSKNSAYYSDLYEGINLKYFLENIVQLPGYKGTVTFSDGTKTLNMKLEDVLSYKGYNGTTKLGGLSPVLAYAKNGSPMVSGKDAAGYEGSITLAGGSALENTITVKNDGGPLAVLFPRAAADSTTVDTLSSVTSITINLSPDNYAHTELPYSDLANNKITVSGEGTRLASAAEFTVADIEGMQTLAVTGDYNIKNSTESQSQLRYRGIPLYSFLNSASIGLKPNADKVIVTCSDGEGYTFDLKDVYKKDYINGQNPAINNLQMILAYGSASITNPDVEDGKPLVKTKTSEEGYIESYGNSGGPIRLVVGQANPDDSNGDKILKDVTSIEVTASEMISWNHSSSEIYKQYLNSPFQLKVVDSKDNTILEKNYTLAELEAMADLVERENITWVGTQEWEGINLWDFVLQEAASISGINDPTSVTVFASDGFSKEIRSIFGMDALRNGIIDGELRVPIILGYAVKGYPLVPSNISDGYTGLVDNSYGPIRMMTHNNQGACLKNTTKIVVKVGAGGTDPVPVTEKDFNIYGLKSGTVAMDIKAIKNITQGQGGKLVREYSWFGDHDNNKETAKQTTTDMVKGAYLSDILLSAGVSGSAVAVDIVTTDGYAPEHYKGLTLGAIEAQGYFVAFDKTTDNGATWTGFSDADKSSPPAISTIRIYRNYDNGTETWYNRVTNVKGVAVSYPVKFDTYAADGAAGNLPLAGIRSIWMDTAKGLWVSTYGGGVAYKSADSNTFKVFNTSSDPKLATSYVSAVAADKNGGVWMTQNASYTDPSGNKGVAYMKNGVLTYYSETDNPKTIPNNYVQEIQLDTSGNIWFGSFGGLTKYSPSTGAWKTWDESDGFPAMSVDNLIFDKDGGVWAGFYPTGAGTEQDPFVGGFAHLDKTGKITSYKQTADYDSDLGSSLLAQVWVRDIAVDQEGGAWVVASGSYSDLANVGGTVWYVNSSGVAEKYTGDQLLGNGSLTGNSEIRMVTVDPDGGLWFGTSADGVFYIKDPGTTAPLTITGHYSGKTGSWTDSSGWNNIYSLDFVGNTLYVGSSAGLAYRTFEFANGGSEDPGNGNGGIPAEYDLAVTGAVSQAKYLTVKELKNLQGLVRVTKTYNSLNSYGTKESFTFEGVYLENLLNDVIGLKAEAKSITVTASDGYNRSFNLDSDELGVYWTDIQGNKIMLAWKENGSNCDLKLVIGQTSEDHVNKPMWIRDVSSITVNTSTKKPGSGTAGGYEGEKPDTVVIGGDTVTRTVTAKVDASVKFEGTTVKANISMENLKDALEQIKNAMDKEGDASTGLIEINAKSGSSDVKTDEIQFVLSADVVKTIVKEKSVNIKIITDLGEFVLTSEMLSTLPANNSGSILIKIESVNKDSIQSTKEIIGDRPVLDFVITAGAEQITNFGDERVLAGISYQANPSENQNQLVVYYINDKGEMTPVKLSGYDGENDSMKFKTDHFSIYGIGYNPMTFSDIQKHWAKKNIEFLASRSIVNGKASDAFDPEGKVTRAEFVTMIANSLDGIQVKGSKSAGFDDVAGGVWYTDYVNWAVANDVIKGYGDGRFGPNDLITREQMAVMMDNFVKAMEINLNTINKKIEFKDQKDISTWSVAATTRMQQSGIINGRTDGNFAPKSTATRAEAATIIKGYIEAMLK